ncbi:unnamed protein product, partial [Nesidiocoris tenuis]
SSQSTKRNTDLRRETPMPRYDDIGWSDCVKAVSDVIPSHRPSIMQWGSSCQEWQREPDVNREVNPEKWFSDSEALLVILGDRPQYYARKQPVEKLIKLTDIDGSWLVWAILGFLLTTAYSSCLITQLTSPEIATKIDTVQQLVENDYMWTSPYAPDVAQVVSVKSQPK